VQKARRDAAGPDLRDLGPWLWVGG